MLCNFYILVLAVVAPVFSASVGGSESSKYVRPCHLDDLVCIRDNLAANSGCSKNVRGSVPGQYTVTNFRFETPFFNSSYLENYVIVRNHDKCVVSEFFFNTEADTAVLALDCAGLDFEANRTLIQHRSLLEDTEYSYNIRGEYPLVRLTTHLPHANALDLCTAFTFGDVTALPAFKVDPNNNSTANFLSRDLTALFIYERETFFYRAHALFRYFVNSYICDFGCNV